MTDWATLGLSGAGFTIDTDGLYFGQYGDGVIYGVTKPLAGAPNFPDFYFGVTLDPAQTYRIEITYDAANVSGHDSGGRSFTITGVQPGSEQDFNDVSGFPVGDLYDGSSNTDDVATVTIGPGIAGWDDGTYGVAAGFNRLMFETDHFGAVSQIRISPAPVLPCNTPVDIDLSTAAFLTNPGATHPGPYGYYDSGAIHPAPDGLGTGVPGFPDFTFGAILLEPSKFYEVTITNDGNSDADGNIPFFLYGAPYGSAQTPGTWPEIYSGDANTLTTTTFTIGPGIDEWDDPDHGVALGWNTIWFETDNLAAILSITIRKKCGGLAPLRLTNRRYGGSGATSLQSLYDRQGGLRLTGPL